MKAWLLIAVSLLIGGCGFGNLKPAEPGTSLALGTVTFTGTGLKESVDFLNDDIESRIRIFYRLDDGGKQSVLTGKNGIFTIAAGTAEKVDLIGMRIVRSGGNVRATYTYQLDGYIYNLHSGDLNEQSQVVLLDEYRWTVRGENWNLTRVLPSRKEIKQQFKQSHPESTWNEVRWRGGW